jgi:hypothetical protein
MDPARRAMSAMLLRASPSSAPPAPCLKRLKTVHGEEQSLSVSLAVILRLWHIRWLVPKQRRLRRIHHTVHATASAAHP